MSLWLVRVVLDSRHRAVRQDLYDIVSLHRRVMSLLPDGLGEQPRQAAGVLFRLDQGRIGPVLLVQSGLEPQPERLPAGYGSVDTRELAPLVDALRPGMLLHYRLAANASKRAWKGDKAGKVVALSGAAAEEWWQRKAEAHGLQLSTLQVSPQPTAQGRDKPVRHAVTRFDGRAIVDDVEKLNAAIRNGVGRGRSHGCGLLTVAPAG